MGLRVCRSASGSLTTVAFFVALTVALPVLGVPINDNKDDAVWVNSSLQLPGGEAVQVQDAYPGVSGSDFDFLNFSASGTNVQASLEEDEPSHGSQETEASVWFKWLCPFNATMLLSTEGSSFDTAVAIYTLVPWDGITVTNEFGVKRVGQGDDVLWNTVLHSQARFDAFEGEVYFFAVGGFRGASGTIMMHGIIESVIIFPPRIAADGLPVVRTQDPELFLDRLGTARNPAQHLHDKFVKITIASPTASAQVFYTTDGSMPVVKETLTQGLMPLGSTQLYGAPISFGSFTVRAIAYHPTLHPSAVVTSPPYQLQATAPSFSPDGGDYDVEVRVRVLGTTDEDGDAVSRIRFTLDGSEPTQASQLYASPLVLTNRSGLVIRARVYTPGMVASNVSDSQPFTVRQPAHQPVITFVGEAEPGVSGDQALVDPVQAVITTNTTGATIYYALGLTFGASGAWAVYTGPVTLPVGENGVHAYAAKAGMADSGFSTATLQVVSPITMLDSNVPVLGEAEEGGYVYFSLYLADDQSDVRLSVTRLVGVTDIFFSAVTRRPSLSSTGSAATISSIASQGAGLELTAQHVRPELALTTNQTVFMSVRGAGAGLTRFILRAEAETTTVVRLDQYYHGTVAIGSWRYLRIYFGTEQQPPQRMVYVTLWQAPADSVGVRIALRKGLPPSTAVLASIPYTIFGSADGVFKLQEDLGPADDDVWFLGVQGLVPIQGVSEVNFTLVIRSTPDDTPWSTSLVREQRVQAQREAEAQALTAGVTVEAEVEAGMWQVFKIEVTAAYQTLEVQVLEDDFFDFAGALAVYVQQDVPPSLTSFLTDGVATTQINAGQQGYWVSTPVTASHTYYIGVHAWMYGQREYLFTITASFTARDPALSPPSIFPLTNNFRYFYSIVSATTYTYYSVIVPATNEDLHIVFRISTGNADVFVSTTNPYPGRDLEGVEWYSQHAAGESADVVVYTQDAGYKPGLYYLSVYAITDLDFGVAAYMDQTARVLTLGNAYGVLATTYSYRYFAVDVPIMYESFQIRAQETAGEDYMTLIVQRGHKPSQIDNIYQGYPSDADGVIEYDVDNAAPGRYYIMVHFFKPGYSGPVLQHSYTLTTLVDASPPAGYGSQEGATEFQVSSVNRWHEQGLERPQSWDTDRPYSEGVVPTIRIGEKHAAEFEESAWVHARFYMDSFVAVLRVWARALTQGLEIQLFVRRGGEPTTITYLNASLSPDSTGVHEVIINRPVAGAFYYVGVYAPVRSLTDAHVWINADTTPRGEFEAPVLQLVSYFTQFDTLEALTYKFYSIEMPGDQRDITVSVTKFSGLTDIVISNIDQFPTKGRMAAAGSPPGYWKSEAEIGGGDEIVVRNFDVGYQSPATYFIAVLAVTTSDYFILARLDRPAPNVRIGTPFYGSVAPTALSTFRFITTLISPSMVLVVQMQDPFTEGLSLYYKEGGVPTLLDYDGIQEVFAGQGQIVLQIPSVKLSVLYYVGVFGVDLGTLALGESYNFRAIVVTAQAFDAFVPTPYPLPVVVPAGGYVAPAADTFSVLSPDVEVNATVSNAAGWVYFRLQIWEPTVITAVLQLTLPPAQEIPVAMVSNSTNLTNATLNSTFINGTNATNATNASVTIVETFQPKLPGGLGLFVHELSLPTVTSSGAGYAWCAQNSSGTGCAIGDTTVELSLDATQLVNGSFVFLGLYGSGCNGSTSCLYDLPFSIIARRPARVRSQETLREGSLTFSLTLPWDDSRFFVIDANGTNVFWLFVTVSSGAADVIVSSLTHFPTRSDPLSPLQTFRSDAAAGNPTIRVRIPVEHPHQHEPTIQFYAGVHATADAEVTLRLELGESARTLEINEALQDQLRYTALEDFFTDWRRTLYVIGTPQHLGRRFALYVLPVDTTCDGVPCASDDCCGGQNPFEHFDVLVQADRQPSDESPLDFIADLSVSGYPNYDCQRFELCEAGASNPHCASACLDGECCALFRQYRVEIEGAQASSWFVAVQGHGRVGVGAGTLLRHTDSFKVVVTLIQEVKGELVEAFPDPLGPDGIQTKAETGHRTFAFQSGGLSSDPFVVRQLQLGVTAHRHLNYGEWAMYKVVAPKGGLLEVELQQEAGLFGLRLVSQRGGLPSARSFSSFLVSAGQEDSTCTADTKPGAEACKVCTQSSARPCLCADSQTEACSALTANAATSSRSSMALGGANATAQVPVSADDTVYIGIYAESPVFSPYTMRMTATMVAVETVPLPCTSVAEFQTEHRSVRRGEVQLIASPAIPENADVTVVLNVSTSLMFGECFYSDSDGNACELRDGSLTWSTWTGHGGREGRPGDCDGCFMESDVDFPGAQIEIWRRQQMTTTISVTQSLCFVDGAWVDVTTVLYDTQPPYHILIADLLDPRVATCGTQPMDLTVPVVRQILLSNLTAADEAECCDRCAGEPSCSFWTFHHSAVCWDCTGQNVSDSDVRVGPTGENIEYVSGYNRTVWSNQTAFVLETGPRCKLVSGPCCVLRNHTEIEKRAAAQPRLGVVSGSFAQCRMTVNGRARMFLTQDIDCDSSTEEAVEELTRDSTTAMEASSLLVQRDDRQIWALPGLGVNESICLEWWDGEEVRNGVVEVVGSAASVRCIRWTSHAVRLAHNDENGDELCVGLVGDSLEIVRCQGDMYLALNLTGDGVDVFLPVNSSRSAFASKEWNATHGVLRVHDTQTCISNQHSLAPEPCFVPGTSDDAAMLRQLWSVTEIDVGSGRGGLHAAGGLCLGALPDCPEWHLLWDQGCSLLWPSPAVLLPCPDAAPSTATVTLLASDPALQAGKPLLAATQGLLPSQFSISFHTEPAPPVVLPDKTLQLRASADTPASLRFEPPPLAGKHTIVVQQRSPVDQNLTVSVHEGLCSSSVVLASTTHHRDGEYVIVEGWERTGLPWCVTVEVSSSSSSSSARRLLLSEEVEVWVRVWTAGRANELESHSAPWLEATADEGWSVESDVRVCGRLKVGEAGAVSCVVSADAGWTAWVPLWVLNRAQVTAEAPAGCKLSVYAQPGELPGNRVWNGTMVASVNETAETPAGFNASSAAREVRSDSPASSQKLLLQGEGEDWWVGVWVHGGASESECPRRGGAVELSAQLVSVDTSVIEPLPLGLTLQMSSADSGPERYFNFSVSGDTVYTLEVGVEGSGADVFVSPSLPRPSRSGMQASTYRSEQVLGNPPITITPDDAWFAVGAWHVGVHLTGAPTNVSLLLNSVATPQILPLGRQFALTSSLLPAAGSTTAFRFRHAAAFSPSLVVSVVEASGRSPSQCPLTVLARFELSPTSARFDAAGGLFTGGRVVVPQAHSVGAAGADWLVVTLSRCAPGSLGNGTACREMEACAACPPSACNSNATSCAPRLVAAGCCWQAPNVTANGTADGCSFLFSVDDDHVLVA